MILFFFLHINLSTFFPAGYHFSWSRTFLQVLRYCRLVLYDYTQTAWKKMYIYSTHLTSNSNIDPVSQRDLRNNYRNLMTSCLAASFCKTESVLSILDKPRLSVFVQEKLKMSEDKTLKRPHLYGLLGEQRAENNLAKRLKLFKEKGTSIHRCDVSILHFNHKKKMDRRNILAQDRNNLRALVDGLRLR